MISTVGPSRGGLDGPAVGVGRLSGGNCLSWGGVPVEVSLRPISFLKIFVIGINFLIFD